MNVHLFIFVAISFAATVGAVVNPCCSFPCHNGGVCIDRSDGSFSCDCASTGFAEPLCTKPATWGMWLKEKLRPHPDTTNRLLANHKAFWDFVNGVPFIQKFLMRLVYKLRGELVDSPALYNSAHHYTTMEVHQNASYYSRALPPVPPGCPTPLGVAGSKTQPEINRLVETLYRRTKFIPEPYGSNQLFTFFAQHFTHMFFKTDVKKGPGFTWGGHGVDLSHVYGPDKKTEDDLRSFRQGYLKTQQVGGEDWPPLLEDAPNVRMLYPPNIPASNRFALGHEFFGLLPGLFVYATIWIREHNRVCDVLRKEHPHWDDERLFQTAKLIITGETIKIVVEDYVQHLSRYNFRLTFDPELLFDEQFQYQNRISVEFNHLYHWHPLMADSFNISGRDYQLSEFVFNSKIALEHGMREMVDSFVRQPAGKVTSNNHGNMTLRVAKETIQHGRELRLQSFNQYRRRFRLHPYTKFEELTDDPAAAEFLRQEYGDVEAVEFYVGMMLEKHRENSMFGATMIEVGGPFSVKGLLSSPICHPRYWRPSTFGGNVGFDIIKTATLEKLFCQNMKDCPRISFKVPEADDKRADEEIVRREEAKNFERILSEL